MKHSLTGLAAVGILALGAHAAPAADCPQPRFTGKAPEADYALRNPLGADTGLDEARRLYLGDGSKVSCATCHGVKGDGRGEMADLFDPLPRNFRCAQTVNGIPDGQLFWIIRYGSPGSSMPPHPALSDRQLWTIVNYLRQLAR
jgi:mono/diheme cytochrome c family protein